MIENISGEQPIRHIKDNFSFNRQNLPSPNPEIEKFDYGSGVFMTIRFGDGNCTVLDLNVFHQKIQCFENIDDHQTTVLASELFRYYLQAHPENLQGRCHPPIYFQNLPSESKDTIPGYIEQRVKII